MQILHSRLLENVLAIATQAGDHLRHFYTQSVAIQFKADHTPVTEADLFISQFVINALKQLTPNVPILSEEHCQVPLAERACWQEYWLIDPLDGTQQFINRTDQFSVIIALVQQHRPVLGVIHAPILDKTYYAMLGSGAFLQKNGKTAPLIAHQKAASLSHLRVAVGTSDRQKIRHALRSDLSVEFVPFGSSSLKAGLVAEGLADCYVRLGDTGEWDTAAAEVLLGELGGSIFDLKFQPLSYNQRETFVNPHFVMAGNKQQDWQAIFQFD